LEPHLSSSQIEDLLQHSATGDEGVAVEGSDETVRTHLKSCEICQEMVRTEQAAMGRFAQLKIQGAAERSPECPPDTIWLQIAVGVTPHGLEGYLSHATECDYCGPILHAAVEDFAEVPHLGEQSRISALRSSTPGWQRRLAEVLHYQVGGGKDAEGAVRAVRSWLGIVLTPRRLAFAVAIVALVAAGLSVSFYLRRNQSAEQLLALAYTEERTLEIRIPGAKYAPIRVERVSGGSNLDKPSALLTAEALIRENLRKSPDDPSWLDARARADLLDGNYESAINSLQHALESRPDGATLRSDLASAYFLKGASAGTAADYSMAIDLLGQVLQEHPNDQIALYNRAITLERMHLYDQAIADWERYLVIDPKGGWSGEARRCAERVKLALQRRGGARLRPLMGPHELLQQVKLGLPATWNVIDDRIEEYELAVVRDWLKQAYPNEADPAPTFSARELRELLRVIAEISRQKHSDTWLSEVLSSSNMPGFPRAVDELSEAVIASEDADYARAYDASKRSQQLFNAMHSSAGESRAKFEEIFALHFSKRAPDCAREAAIHLDSMRARKFEWIALQTQIEQGICEILMGDYGSARSTLDAVVNSAHSLRYSATEIRALTMAGLVAWSEGNSEVAWADIEAGLNLCWTNSCPEMSMYSLYANMDNFAEDSRQWYLEVLLAEQALLTLGDDPDHLMRAVEHNRLGKAAMLAHNPGVARKHFAIADQLLRSGPQTDVTNNYQAVIQIDLAKLASEQGDAPSAFKCLSAVRHPLRKVADQYVLLDYYQTLGHLQLKTGDVGGAVESLQWALALAEMQLASLDSEHDKLAWQQLNGGTYRDLVEARLMQGMPVSALTIWEWYLGAPLRSKQVVDAAERPHVIVTDVFYRIQTGEKAPPLPDLQAVNRTLDHLHHSTAISFAILSGKVAVWVSDDRGVFFNWLEVNGKSVALTVRQFKRACSDPDGDRVALDSESRQLYNSLLAPINNYLTPERPLIFDGESDLVDAPLQSLIDKHGKYVADSFSVTTIPGILYSRTDGTALNITADTSSLVVAVPAAKANSSRSSLSPLPDVLDEAADITRRFHNARLLSAGEIEEASLADYLRRAIVFHFAGHSLSTSSGTELVLSNQSHGSPSDGFNATKVISLGPNHLRLAVLSACTTETGRDRGIQDPNGLVSAFLEIGVPHVVASRWNVDSAVTAKFMAAFYDELLAGNSVAKSVRYAGMLIRASPETRHPYYWAAFAAFGQP
jgi:CHAT domain-containing protein/tetratricopeptide (TPR) repeat protein